MQQDQHLQEAFLGRIQAEETVVTVFLVTGYPMKGIVRDFDDFSVLLEVDGHEMLVYKHAISTFSPLREKDLAEASADPA